MTHTTFSSAANMLKHSNQRVSFARLLVFLALGAVGSVQGCSVDLDDTTSSKCSSTSQCKQDYFCDVVAKKCKPEPEIGLFGGFSCPIVTCTYATEQDVHDDICQEDLFDPGREIHGTSEVLGQEEGTRFAFTLMSECIVRIYPPGYLEPSLSVTWTVSDGGPDFLLLASVTMPYQYIQAYTAYVLPEAPMSAYDSGVIAIASEFDAFVYINNGGKLTFNKPPYQGAKVKGNIFTHLTRLPQQGDSNYGATCQGIATCGGERGDFCWATSAENDDPSLGTCTKLCDGDQECPGVPFFCSGVGICYLPCTGPNAVQCPQGQLCVQFTDLNEPSHCELRLLTRTLF